MSGGSATVPSGFRPRDITEVWTPIVGMSSVSGTERGSGWPLVRVAALDGDRDGAGVGTGEVSTAATTLSALESGGAWGRAPIMIIAIPRPAMMAAARVRIRTSDSGSQYRLHPRRPRGVVTMPAANAAR